MYDLLFSWHLDAPVLIGLLVAQSIYVLLMQRHWRKTQNYNSRATIAWSVGLIVVFIALESPVDTIGETRLLSVHMLQHELLLTVAPVFLLLGLFPRLVVPLTRPIFKPLLRNRHTHKLLRVVLAPYSTLGIWLILLYIWHIPALYMLALTSGTVHILEHFSFILAGMLFWLPIIEPVPGLTKMRPLAKLSYLALGQVGTVPLASILLWSSTPIYSFYALRMPLWGISHIFDQQLAGVIMMVVDMLVVSTLAIMIAFDALAFAEWQHKRTQPVQVLNVQTGEQY